MANLGTLLENYKTVSLVGMAKNAGKTTALNYLIEHNAKRDIPLALTSIGRDGEELDIVTATKKPKIYVPKGSVIATAEGLLGLADITAEIHKCMDINTPMGRILIVRARSGGFVQLGGAPTTGQTLEIVAEFWKLGIGKILIDGAISRKNISNPTLAEAVVLCTGASLAENIGTVVKKTLHAAEILMLPAYIANGNKMFNSTKATHKNQEQCTGRGLPFPGDDSPTPFFFQGAVTDAKITAFLHSGDEVKNRIFVAEEPSKILIGAKAYEKLLARGGKLCVKSTANLAAITVNPVSPKGFTFPKEEFLHEMSNAVGVPVFDVLNA